MSHKPFWLLTAAIILAAVSTGCQLLGGDHSGLEQLRREGLQQMVYPEAVNLRRSETPKERKILQGYTTSPKMMDLYGVNAPDQEVAVYYQQKLTEMGWKLISDKTDTFNYSRTITLRKEKMTVQVRFWIKRDVAREFPSIKADDYSTIYDVFLIGPSD